MDLRNRLPELLSPAIAWAEIESKRGYAHGVPLNAAGAALAQRVGVKHPENIRIVAVDSLPFPSDPQLSEAAVEVGLLGPNSTGLTLLYTVFLCKRDNRLTLLAHECRHVAQYEQAGSIAKFLTIYFEQLATVGYNDAPLERDAREHEIFAA